MTATFIKQVTEVEVPAASGGAAQCGNHLRLFGHVYKAGRHHKLKLEAVPVGDALGLHRRLSCRPEWRLGTSRHCERRALLQGRGLRQVRANPGRRSIATGHGKKTAGYTRRHAVGRPVPALARQPDDRARANGIGKSLDRTSFPRPRAIEIRAGHRASCRRPTAQGPHQAAGGHAMKRFRQAASPSRQRPSWTGTDNVRMSKADLDFIRNLRNFDLTMLISEVNDDGWDYAAKMLPRMR